ncbi:MAG TPA: glucose 1-dehydrogenase [Acidocella sp.]|nr:glucose 1-dehydrogenase [Acidocella sp.]
MKRLSGKTCLVTGAANGIGLAAATRLAQEGAKVLLTDINAAQGEAATATLAESGLAARFQQHDVTQRDAWESALHTAKEFGGRIDVIVNNAGIVIPGSIESVDWASWRKTLDINLDGVFHGLQLGVREMKEHGGSIVNLASIEGIVGEPMALAYNVTKGGVRLLTKSAAVHCAKSGYKIRINAVCPGFVETPLVLNAIGAMPPEIAHGFQAKVLNRTPMGRLAQPAEVANAILFLCSDESSYVTGSDLLVDGGYTAG